MRSTRLSADLGSGDLARLTALLWDLGERIAILKRLILGSILHFAGVFGSMGMSEVLLLAAGDSVIVRGLSAGPSGLYHS